SLADAEAEAIQAGDWAQAHLCQKAIKQLQERIADRSRQLPADQPPVKNFETQELRAAVGRLIELEQRNLALLQDQMHALHAESGQLRQASKTLHRIQRTYAPARPAVWSSFS